jgi:hypothetical protein
VIKDCARRGQVDDWQMWPKVMWSSKSWLPTMDGERNIKIAFVDSIVASLD